MKFCYVIAIIISLSLINFTSASLVVTLNNPEDMNYSTYNVSFNATGLAPEQVINMSLYTNTTGTWGLTATKNTTLVNNTVTIVSDNTFYQSTADAYELVLTKTVNSHLIHTNVSLKCDGPSGCYATLEYKYTDGTKLNVTKYMSYNDNYNWTFENTQFTKNVSNTSLYLYAPSTLGYVNATVLRWYSVPEKYLTYNLVISQPIIWNVLTCNTTACLFSASNRTVLLDFPNITINYPASSISIPTITVNATFTANGTMDMCYYNITKGTNTEKPNTFINCSAFNDTYTLTLNTGDYVINFWGNTTQGISNWISKNFTYSVSGGTGGGGGGGSISQPDELTFGKTESICTQFKTTFATAIATSRTQDKIIDKLKTIWVSLWDYLLCSSTASIYPI